MDFIMNAQKSVSPMELLEKKGKGEWQGSNHSQGSDFHLGREEFAALFGVGAEDFDESSMETLFTDQSQRPAAAR